MKTDNWFWTISYRLNVDSPRQPVQAVPGAAPVAAAINSLTDVVIAPNLLEAVRKLEAFNRANQPGFQSIHVTAATIGANQRPVIV